MSAAVEDRAVAAWRETLETLALERPRPSGVRFVELCGGEYDGHMYPVPVPSADDKLAVPVNSSESMIAVYLLLGNRASYVGIHPHPLHIARHAASRPRVRLDLGEPRA